MEMTITAQRVKQAAALVYEQMRKDHAGNWGMNINAWDWVPGVGVIAILSYYEQSGDAELLTYLTEWTRRNKGASEQLKVINSMAPFAIFPELYRKSSDPYYLEAALRIGEWMMNEAPRTREGAFEHTVTENANFPEQVWADTVFMAVLFLARLARLTKRQDFAEESLRQLALHLRLLQDQETGVLFHGWNCITRDHMSAARWTRANAWVAVGTPMILRELAGGTEIPEEIGSRYRRLMEGLVRYQQENGLWPTVMDRPDFYQETSGSAGIACGIVLGIREGLLSPTMKGAADRAAEAVLNKIDAAGTVTGVSGGTPVMESVEAYNRIACYPTLYGQGLVLMLLAQYLPEPHLDGIRM
ncbi:glycoside hydrolase family 88/105 protein [Paenibacillus silviterrae]|uniref:glycoside hydrolase family 88/105 protein n=1 Tax=Paenibacillus silviterrae TaxID=3242194 RepID=UPI002542FDFA|nr:glycoside hydrolase family 88 protein [Paenibacillus chinjuensis]